MDLSQCFIAKSWSVDTRCCTGYQCCPHLVVMSLNDFQEHSGPILNWLGEDLKKIAAIVVVYQNPQLLQNSK